MAGPAPGLRGTARRFAGRARRRLLHLLGGEPRMSAAEAKRVRKQQVRRARARVAREQARAAVPPKPLPKLTPSERQALRRECIFATADRDGTMLEIGAAHHGTLPRRDGFRAKIADHLDRDGLVEKYSGYEQYSADDIEDVDFVLVPGESLSDVIDEKFDLVLASHVLEHTTSLVHFLNDVTELLTDGGTLALIVPDRRYCFDRFRERTSIGRVIDTWRDPPAVHTVGTMVDFRLNAVRHRNTTSWAQHHRGDYSYVHELDAARQAVRTEPPEHYVDVHNWVFTPNHLRLMLADLHDLGLIRLREAFYRSTVGNEFFINLTVGGPGPGLSRAELQQLADEELRADVPTFAAPPDEA